MRIHIISASIAFLAAASISTTSKVNVVDGFDLPTNSILTRRTTSHHGRHGLWLSRTNGSQLRTYRLLHRSRFLSTTSVYMADTSRGSSSSSSSSTNTLSPRIERQRQQLLLELEQAQIKRQQIIDEISKTNTRRAQLEQLMKQTEQDVTKKQQKLDQFDKRVATGGGGGGGGLGLFGTFVGSTAVIGGGFVAVRTILQQREEKVAEQQRLEEEAAIKAKEAAIKAKEASNTASLLIPLVGVGAALGAIVAPLLGDEALTKTGSGIAKNTEGTTPPTKKSFTSLKQQTAKIGDNTIALPYLDRKINRAEQKLNKAQQKVEMKQAAVASEEKALQELESKLSGLDSTILAQDPAIKRAEERLEQERAALEKAELERTVAEEQQREAAAKAEEARIAVEKQAAEEKAIAEQLAAEQAEKARIEAEKQAAKERADRLAAEQEAAALAAKQQENTALLQQLKDQAEKLKEDGTPQVPTVSQMIAGKKLPSEVKDKGHSNLFNVDLSKVVVGSVALAGFAVAAAIMAADEPVTSTYKVTGKSPEDYVKSGKRSKTMSISSGPPPQGTKSSPSQPKGESLPSQIQKDVPAKASVPSTAMKYTPAPLQNENSTTVQPKKSYSPFGRKPQAAKSDSLYSAPMTSSQSTLPNPTPSESTPTMTTTKASTIPQSTGTSPRPQSSAKTSYSPFGRKPVAARNDSLYSAPNGNYESRSSSPSSSSYNFGMGREDQSSSSSELPFAATTLDDSTKNDDFVSASVAIPPAFPSSSSSGSSGRGNPKKSYSPFGTKPAASSSGSGGGYLDGL